MLTVSPTRVKPGYVPTVGMKLPFPKTETFRQLARNVETEDTMKNSDDIKTLLNALGIAAEASLAFYRAAIGAGATSEEAYILTRAYLAASMQSGRNEEGGE